MLPILALSLALSAQPLPVPTALDTEVHKVMADTGAKGLAIAVIDHGKVQYVQAYGVRNAKGDPLQTDTIMYGASLTKTVFAYAVMHLVDQDKLKLDTPIADYLSKPLPDYPTQPRYDSWSDLKGDNRWHLITPRMVLTHSTGFANFSFVEPDQKLHIHFQPGSRYAYSGAGMLLLQFGIEQGLGRDVGDLTQNEVFTPLGMTRTSLKWRDDFAGNLANGFNDQGVEQEHDERSKVRAAGSMDTTIADMAKFAAALVRGEGLSDRSYDQMFRPQLHIRTKTQFPSLQDELPASQQRSDLFAGLGVVVFDGPQGHGFFKGGHDGQTGNTLVCVQGKRRCVVILSNDVRAEAGYAELVKFVLGETGVPYDWEYGGQAGKSQ